MFFMRGFFFKYRGTLVKHHTGRFYYPGDVNPTQTLYLDPIKSKLDAYRARYRYILYRTGLSFKPKLQLFSTHCNTHPLVFGKKIPSGRGLGSQKKTRRVRLKDYFIRSLLFRFLVNLWGSNLSICFFRNLQKSLLTAELIFVKLQQHRIFCITPAPLYTQRQKDRYPWSNGFLAIYLSLKHRDPTLLLSWLKDRLRVISMFAHLRFFRILGLLLKSTVLHFFNVFKLKGFNFYLVGKISVTGNAMSRSYRSFAGKRSNSSLQLRLASNFTIIRTPTGCLGFTLSFFF